MNLKVREEIAVAIGQIPSGMFVLTARTEDRRTALLVSWVQQVCFDPPMICVAIKKGTPIMPLISQSHKFGLCQLPEGERIILRKFTSEVDSSDDPFLGYHMLPQTVTGVPILAHVLAYLECAMVSHVDVDGDHNLFVGRVVAGKFFGGKPEIRLRTNGFRY